MNDFTFEWCDHNARIRNIDWYLVFEDVPLELRNLEYKWSEGV
jgi:hypothetical protein